MRSGRQSGITIFQILIFIALVWGTVTFAVPHIGPMMSRLTGQGSGTQQYFNRLLLGIEGNRTAEGETPSAQSCSSLVLDRTNSSTIKSCLYQPLASRDFYIVTVIGNSGEVFRYQGQGGK